jgi:hypothetical protein
MRRVLTAGLFALTLAACDRNAPPPQVTKESAPPPDAQPTGPQAAVAAKPGASLPPASAPYRYVGRWAANAAACEHGTWNFDERKLVTAGEVACKFDRIERTAAGYDIAATCTAEAPPAAYHLALTFAESARAMLVEGGPFSHPVGLIWCGAA